LHWAADEGDDKVLEMLLEAGPMVEQQNSGGQTAIQLARDRSRGAVVRVLERRMEDIEIIWF
jgi:ankyrin repeat protein